MKVNLSDKAVADLDEISDYIAADSVFFANRTVNQILQVTEQLSRFPQSGRVSTEYNDPNIRERFFRGYRIGYKILEHSIEIATIRHMSRLSMDIESK